MLENDSLELLHERKTACFGKPLSDGEKRVICLPAYSIRKDPKTGRDYGNHCVDLFFADRRGNVVIDCTFFTGMGFIGDFRYNLICTGFGYHMPERESEYDSDNGNDCFLREGPCFYHMGSAMYGDVILERLINEGSAGVWDEIDSAFKKKVIVETL